ncbi:MAG: nucleotidyltransferase family protein [Chitinophagaceae bacterium]|nr:MAG: nucleotidyltransferase family protein [Chitinophagaceae bacterium]
MDKIGIIILAAGESVRLGRPKQNLYYNGKSLVQHVSDEAKKAGLDPVIVVTGAFEKEVLEKLDTDGLTISHNKDWQQGMAAGIKSGLNALDTAGAFDAVIVSVCDQPFLSATIFESLKEARLHTGKGIIASAYAGTVGVPVLFDKKYFTALENAEEAEGTKKLIHQFREDLAHVDFEAGSIDIDTEEDYNLLLDQSSEGSLQ